MSFGDELLKVNVRTELGPGSAGVLGFSWAPNSFLISSNHVNMRERGIGQSHGIRFDIRHVEARTGSDGRGEMRPFQGDRVQPGVKR